MLDKTGWVKAYRSIMGKGYYKRSHYVHLWLHILLKANHAESEFMLNGKIEKIMPGQFVTGRHILSEETGISASTVEDILYLFETEQQIRQQKTNKFRLLTVVNWEQYQGEQQQFRQLADNKPTTGRQPADTNKNVRRIRTKNIYIKPTREEVSEYIREKNYNVDPNQWYDFYETRGWVVGKNRTPIKDWKAAVRTWTHGNSSGNSRDVGKNFCRIVEETKEQKIENLKANIGRLESSSPLCVADSTLLSRLKDRLKELENEEVSDNAQIKN